MAGREPFFSFAASSDVLGPLSTPEPQAHSSFRQALHELSLAMGPLGNELISADRETVQLNSNFCWIDATAMLARKRRRQVPLQVPLGVRAAALCTGELLEGLDGITPSFDHWLLRERVALLTNSAIYSRKRLISPLGQKRI